MNRLYTRLGLSAVALLVLLLTGCAASPAADAPPPQAIEIIATDIAFSQDTLSAQVGQEVTVHLRNQGALEHDFTVVGMEAEVVASNTEGESAAHQGHSSGTEPQVHVAALGGKGGEVTFIPQAAGTYEFYCTVAGHKEAGMAGTLTVQ